MNTSTPSSHFATDPKPRKRRQGSRAKLAQRFFEDMYAAWEEQGPSVIARAFFHDPVQSMSVVARLMPQKIEVSAPTDGMSDERLAELLDYAERMAGLKAAQAKVVQGSVITHAPNHENGVALIAAEEGGGGPLREEGGGGKYTPHTTPAAPENRPDRSSENATEEVCNALNPPLAQSGDEQESRVPYPVGKPFATPDHVVEKQNRSRLGGEEAIDPNSLF